MRPVFTRKFSFFIFQFLFATVLFCPAELFAQPSAFSGVNKIANMPEGTAKLDSIIKFTSQHRKDSSMEKLFREGLRMVKKSGYSGYEARLLDGYGVFKRDFSKYSDALKLHRQALEIAKATQDEKTEMIALNNIGVVFRRLDQNAEALNNHIAALKIAEKVKDDYSASVSLNSIGNIHIALGNYKDAIEYFKKCLPIAIKAKNDLGIAINLSNIGEAYDKMENMDSAYKYYSDGLEYNKKIDSQKGIGICYGLLGNVFKKQGKYMLATGLFEKALDISNKLGDRLFIASSYNNLGDVLLLRKEPTGAGKMFEDALKIADTIGSKTEMKNAYNGLMRVKSYSGDFKNALKYSNLEKLYNDSINLENNNRHVRQMEAIYQNDSERARMKLMERTSQNDKIVIVGSLILFLLLLLTGLLYYLRNRLLERNKSLQRELEIRSQIAADLHDDMGSSLSSIHIFSELLRKPGQKSEELLNKIEENAKDTLEALDDIIWLVKPSNDKFSNLSLHISQYAIPLFEGKNIKFDIDFPESIAEIALPMETRRNIFLIIKESINNLVKYAECTEAVVKAEHNNDTIIFTVQDNGKGFNPEMLTTRNGVKNLRARAARIDGELNINSAPGKGTKITLVVKSDKLIGAA